MQLDKIVSYHKALADTTRIRMLILLAEREWSGQELAERLHVTPATITHHATKLREASLINERREKNTIYFSLNDYFIHSGAKGTIELIYKNAEAKEVQEMEQDKQKFRDTVIRNFYMANGEGKLKQIPSQLKKKLIVLEYMVSRLEQGRKYTEKEINAFIKQYHDDFATIRREFIMHQYMFRENEIYELNPKELWAKWETLS